MRKLNQKQLLTRLQKIEVLVLDHDGVLTTPFVYMGVIMSKKAAAEYEPSRRVFKDALELARYSHRDGQGQDQVAKIGIKQVILTTQRSGHPFVRGQKMKLPVVQTQDKLAGLKSWLVKNYPSVGLDRICAVGDDTGDLPLFEAVGLAVCVGDGHPSAKQAAHFVTTAFGGDGAVRELCDLILVARAKAGQRHRSE